MIKSVLQTLNAKSQNKKRSRIIYDNYSVEFSAKSISSFETPTVTGVFLQSYNHLQPPDADGL